MSGHVGLQHCTLMIAELRRGRLKAGGLPPVRGAWRGGRYSALSRCSVPCLFGDWGEGKSHFLRLLSDQVNASADRHDGLAHDAVRQVRFNAWHYAETDLWASLVAEIFNQLAVPLDRSEKSDIGLRQRQQSRLTAELLAKRKISERLAAACSRRDQLRTVTSSNSRWRSLSSRHQSERRDAARGVDPGLADQVGSLYAAATGNVTWLRVKLIEGRRLMRALPWWGWLAILLMVAATVALLVGVLPWLARLAEGTGFGALLALGCAVAAAYRNALAGLQGRLHQTLIAVGRVKDAQRRYVETAVTVAEAEVATLQRQLQDLTPAGALAGLAADRAADDSYCTGRRRTPRGHRRRRTLGVNPYPIPGEDLPDRAHIAPVDYHRVQ